MSALETQVGGSHYKDLPIQPMEYSMANKLDACQHTIVKYVTRFRAKDGIKDLEKARHTLDMLIEFERAAAAELAAVAAMNAVTKPANDNLPALDMRPYSNTKLMAMASGDCRAGSVEYMCASCKMSGREACAFVTNGTSDNA